MPTFSKKTWSTEEVITSSGLNQMSDNEEYAHNGLYQCLVSYFAETGEEGESYDDFALGRVYIPENYGNLIAGFKMKVSTGKTATFKITLDSLSVETTSTANSYENKTANIDISSLSAGWYDLMLSLKISAAGIGDFAYVKGISIYAEPDGKT